MTILQAILLGIIQGITEFLPISSSAHLVLVPFLLNWKLAEKEAFVFDVLVQMGTLIAVIIYFRKDLVAIIKAFVQGIIKREPFKDYDSRSGWLIILATIPAGLIGMLFKDKIEASFGNVVMVAIMLLITAGLMFAAERLGKKTRSGESLSWLDTLVMGLFQAAAVFPGISRSGATISGGLLRQLERKTAARFSFLMSIPIMAAAGLLSVFDLLELPNLSSFLPVMSVGFITAEVVGYLAIAWLMKFLTKKPLWYFSIYCVVIAVVTLIVNYVR